MNTTELFKNSIPELEALPLTPKVFWYVSAGLDFRSLVFLTDFNIDKLKTNYKREFTKPDLFVFNGLGPEVRDLRKMLSTNKEAVLYNDANTTIIGKNYKVLGLNKSKEQYVYNPSYINMNNLNFPLEGREAFYFEVEVIGKNTYHYNEVQKVLYIEHENIDVFEKIILKNYFDVEYLCATREGISGGGCRKSIVSHIYEDASPSFYSAYGFRPKFNILFNDRTSRSFEKNIRHSDFVNVKKGYHHYLPEAKPYDSFWVDSHIYKLDYKMEKVDKLMELNELLAL
jgi:hypothetical protein